MGGLILVYANIICRSVSNNLTNNVLGLAARIYTAADAVNGAIGKLYMFLLIFPTFSSSIFFNLLCSAKKSLLPFFQIHFNCISPYKNPPPTGWVDKNIITYRNYYKHRLRSSRRHSK
jgi:hypothetical protein